MNKVDPKILLGRILQRMIDLGYSQVEGYNRFNGIPDFLLPDFG